VNPTPILFLDFDGVLHPGSGLGQTRFSRATALEAALAGRELRIVVS